MRPQEHAALELALRVVCEEAVREVDDVREPSLYNLGKSLLHWRLRPAPAARVIQPPAEDAAEASVQPPADRGADPLRGLAAGLHGPRRLEQRAVRGQDERPVLAADPLLLELAGDEARREIGERLFIQRGQDANERAALGPDAALPVADRHARDLVREAKPHQIAFALLGQAEPC